MRTSVLQTDLGVAPGSVQLAKWRVLANSLLRKRRQRGARRSRMARKKRRGWA